VPPSAWGTEERLRELFSDRVSSLETKRQHVEICYHDTAALFELFREWFGPVSTVWHTLEKPQREKFRDSWIALAEDFNVARDRDRLSFTAGDFFTDSLPQADVLVMGHILHDWNLDEKRLLLRKAYDALPEAGALIVYDAIIDDERRSNAFGLLMSLNMLIETPGGFDYTGADCRAWMQEAGFRHSYVEHLVGPDSMVVAIK
jgi:O-methyltransferase domain